MKLNKKGITRLVILTKNYAIKIPNFLYEHDHFLQGCKANWSERKYYKQHINATYKGNMVKHVAPSYFCSLFGLIQIQRRCEPCLEDLTQKQKELFKPLCWGDNKKENFGLLNGKLVCVDYP